MRCLAIVLILLLAKSALGAEIVMAKYKYRDGNVIYLNYPEYVICDNCKARDRLKQRPKPPPLSIELSSPDLSILFKINSAKLMEEERKKLIAFSQNHKGATVDVTGYTCWLGDENFNHKLALERATAVAKFLVKHGVKVSLVQGFGKCCYIDLEHPEPNRRVEIRIEHKALSKK